MVKKSLQILHFGHAPLPPAIAESTPACANRHPGRWVLNLCMAQNLASTHLDARLATLVRRLPQSIQTSMDDVPLHFIASRSRARMLRGYHADRRALTKISHIDKPDIIHAHGFENAYALAAQDTKRPYVITAQGLMFMIIPMLNPPLFSWLRIIRIHEHIALKKARHVIAKSDTVAEALKQRYPHLELHRIPNTFDPRLLDIREPREPNTLVFVGSVDPRKGVHIVREALEIVQRDIPDVRFWIVGDTEDCPKPGYKATEVTALKDLLGERFKMYGRVSGLEVGRIVARASALVAPSLEEMFGNQLIEALLVGTPGIVTEGTGLAENTRRFGNATVVPQQDPQALAESIIQTLLRESFPEREQARQGIIETMGPETVTKAHYEIYNKIIDQTKKGTCYET